MMFLRKYFCFSPKMYNLDGDKDLWSELETTIQPLLDML